MLQPPQAVVFVTYLGQMEFETGTQIIAIKVPDS